MYAKYIHMAKSWAITCFVSFFIISWGIPFLCFFAMQFGTQNLFSDTQFPMGSVTGIDIDALGRIYCIDGVYGRLQVFDAQGHFFKGCFLPPGRGSAGLKVEPDGSIGVLKRGKLYKYNIEGNILSIQEEYSAEDYSSFRKHMVINDSGESYRSVESFLWPWKLEKSCDSVSTEIISEPFSLWIIRFPFPSIGLFLVCIACFTMFEKYFGTSDALKQVKSSYKASQLNH